jgi:hypothetical protein
MLSLSYILVTLGIIMCLCGFNNQKQQTKKKVVQTDVKVVPRDVYDEIALNNVLSTQYIDHNIENEMSNIVKHKQD